MSVDISYHDQLIIIKMARPEKRNALNSEITAGIDKAMNELEDNPKLLCGILTGDKSIFSAGADLATGAGEPTERGGTVGLIHRKRTKPLIAAVEGLALGGGLELILCCDLVVASRTAAFGLPEIKRGLMPDFGGAFRVSRFLPINIAREMFLTAENMSAERAERYGFVNSIVEPGLALDGAIKLAEKICSNAPLAVRAALHVFNSEVSGDESESWKRSDAEHAKLMRSDDVKEGINAFLEKREAKWLGK